MLPAWTGRSQPTPRRLRLGHSHFGATPWSGYAVGGILAWVLDREGRYRSQPPRGCGVIMSVVLPSFRMSRDHHGGRSSGSGLMVWSGIRRYLSGGAGHGARS